LEIEERMEMLERDMDALECGNNAWQARVEKTLGTRWLLEITLIGGISLALFWLAAKVV
jgi:hypothetical protein